MFIDKQLFLHAMLRVSDTSLFPLAEPSIYAVNPDVGQALSPVASGAKDSVELQ